MNVKVEAAMRRRDVDNDRKGRGPQKEVVKCIRDLNLRFKWKFSKIYEYRKISISKHYTRTYELPVLKRWSYITDHGYMLCVETPVCKQRWDINLRDKNGNIIRTLTTQFIRSLNQALIEAENKYFEIFPVDAEYGTRKEVTYQHGQRR